MVTEGVECLERDIPAHLERLAPEEPARGHLWLLSQPLLDFDGRLGYNAADHLKSVIGGIQTFFPVENGKMVRGAPAEVYFVEYDGPLARTVFVQIMGQALEGGAHEDNPVNRSQWAHRTARRSPAAGTWIPGGAMMRRPMGDPG